MDYRPNLYASICITLPLAAIVLALRLLARRTTRAGYGIDDWLAVVAFVRYFAFQPLVCNATADTGFLQIGALGYSVDNLVCKNTSAILSISYST